jgi:hypothetical protein
MDPATAAETPPCAKQDFTRRVRKGLIPLQEDHLTRESTTLNILKHMNLSTKSMFPEDAGFFDFEGKVGSVVSHFAPHGLTLPAYLGAVVRQPKLFHQKPATVIGHVERVVDYFRKDGLTCEKYLRAATKEPLLFYRKPQTIIRRVDLIAGLHRKELLNLPRSADTPRADIAAVLEFMLNHPMLFVMPEENIARPELLARATTAEPSRKLMMPYCDAIEGSSQNLFLDSR